MEAVEASGIAFTVTEDTDGLTIRLYDVTSWLKVGVRVNPSTPRPDSLLLGLPFPAGCDRHSAACLDTPES